MVVPYVQRTTANRRQGSDHLAGSRLGVVAHAGECLMGNQKSDQPAILQGLANLCGEGRDKAIGHHDAHHEGAAMGRGTRGWETSSTDVQRPVAAEGARVRPLGREVSPVNGQRDDGLVEGDGLIIS